MKCHALIWSLLLLASALRAEQPSASSLEDLGAKLRQAIALKDEVALENLLLLEDVSDVGKAEAIAQWKAIFAWPEITVTVGPKVKSLDKTETVNGRKYGLNGHFEGTIYVTSAVDPKKSEFFPAGRGYRGGYKLLLPALVLEGTPVPFKTNQWISPYQPKRYAGDLRSSKAGDIVQDPWSGRYFVIPKSP